MRIRRWRAFDAIRRSRASSVPGLPTTPPPITSGPVHLPHRDVAAGVLPQDVGLAVAVEIADAGDLPAVRDRRTDDGARRYRGPFISQIATLPLVFCHRMSDLPSPLKSPVPAKCQLGPGSAPTTAAADHAGAVHLPDGDVAAGVLPQDIGLAVAVEIAGAAMLPVGPGRQADEPLRDRRWCRSSPRSRHSRWCSATGCRTAVAVEIAGADLPARVGKPTARSASSWCRSSPRSRRAPLVSCHRMSGLAVAVEVAGADRGQLGRGRRPTTRWRAVVPFISQIADLAVLFCHKMSDLPSPLKSLVSRCVLKGVVMRPISPTVAESLVPIAVNHSAPSGPAVMSAG